MRHRLMFISLPLVALFLALSPTALASSKWYVDGVNGNDNNNCKSRQHACKTIGHAISLASSGDSIMVAAATYTENLTIAFSLKIVGSGAATTIIDGGFRGTVVTISSTNAHVTLSQLTIHNGVAGSGGGIYNFGTLTINNTTVSGNTADDSVSGSGGGIYNNGGRLTINHSTVSRNTAASLNGDGHGGGIYNAHGGPLTISNSTISGNTAGHSGGHSAAGGGISNGGPLTISNSTISGNSAAALSGDPGLASGGGISNGGPLTISNSTISGNSAVATSTRASSAVGGGIFNYSTLTINNSTLSGNSARGGSGGLGGGIYDSGSATLQNSIVANSPSGGNCNGAVTSNGYNLSSDNTCNFNNTGDFNNTDPKLGPLQNNGGPTQTQALLAGSPAIDEGNPSGCTDGNGHLLKTDQRGKPRPDKEDTGGCDRGAYERQKD